MAYSYMNISRGVVLVVQYYRIKKIQTGILKGRVWKKNKVEKNYVIHKVQNIKFLFFASMAIFLVIIKAKLRVL